mmetsp:Transcript_25157/g.69522  ORF Transcript_25157/g.69522 Transcript_25157/m.69522 type:complete len:246 (-) Transcript_25157:241-978(-)
MTRTKLAFSIPMRKMLSSESTFGAKILNDPGLAADCMEKGKKLPRATLPSSSRQHRDSFCPRSNGTVYSGLGKSKSNCMNCVLPKRFRARKVQTPHPSFSSSKGMGVVSCVGFQLSAKRSIRPWISFNILFNRPVATDEPSMRRSERENISAMQNVAAAILTMLDLLMASNDCSNTWCIGFLAAAAADEEAPVVNSTLVGRRGWSKLTDTLPDMNSMAAPLAALPPAPAALLSKRLRLSRLLGSF